MNVLVPRAAVESNGQIASKTLVQAGITGLGHRVPDRILTNAELETLVETSDEWIRDRTGIEERRIVAPGENLASLCEAAARSALENAGLSALDLDLIIVATCTPENLFPSTAAQVQNALGARCGAFDLEAACSGFVYALICASQFIATGTMKNILVIGGEVMSRYVDWTDRNTCILFGDGAGAAVVSAVEDGFGIIGFDLGADGSGGELLHCAVRPTETNNAQIFQNGREVYKFAVEQMGATAVRALESCGLSGEDVDLLVPHQANIRIIKSAAKRLKMPMEKVFVNLQKYGNTSAATIPIALSEARQSNRIQSGDTVVLVGFGAGLTWASAVLKWS
ncbi:3-oxoacyl-[acyl-carrier-protein] synthase 3 protein 1 [Abditibacteriota bacterium]|nr:3-oxoacyl-[acyl-carrier-protein] synthase 3 protein 1 [Abditibacteriota bacterium]